MKKNTLKTCSVSQCSKIAVSVGMCKSHYRQHYNEKNRTKVFEYNKKYYEKNKKRISEYRKEYRAKNRNKILAYNKKYREENREILNEKTRLYYAKLKKQKK